MNKTDRIVLFGGTFDPVHLGHIEVAAYALNSLAADKLIFVPAYQNPHKRSMPCEGHHRLAMIQRAIEGIDKFSVCDVELRDRSTSYTLDTISYFRDQYGRDAQLFWLIGADQLTDFDRWYRIDDLLDLCRVSIMVRGDYPPPDVSRFKGVFSDRQVQQLHNDILQTPQILLSSTEIRRQLSRGRIPEGALHPAVEEYIRRHCLYGFKGD